MKSAEGTDVLSAFYSKSIDFSYNLCDNNLVK